MGKPLSLAFVGHIGANVVSEAQLESCGNSQWFVESEEVLAHKVWIGGAA